MRTTTQEALLPAYIAFTGKRKPCDAAQEAAELRRLPDNAQAKPTTSEAKTPSKSRIVKEYSQQSPQPAGSRKIQ